MRHSNLLGGTLLPVALLVLASCSGKNADSGSGELPHIDWVGNKNILTYDLEGNFKGSAVPANKLRLSDIRGA